MHVTAGECAPAGIRETPGRIASDLDAVCVEWSQLPEIAIRLLEVVGEDLLELDASVDLGVDLVRPGDEGLVEGGPRPLEHPVVGSITDQKVLEPVAMLAGRRRRFGAHEASPLESPQMSGQVGSH